ncbi:MAG: M20 family metallopeptidase [Deltaproteobacteria bacterium]|nr:M20 family metallopeptidase [Deltaproteobacteria bacterium]
MKDNLNLKTELITAADALKDRLTSLSDSFYRSPELGLEEHKTSAAMQGMLRGHGFFVEQGVAGMPTAFKATIGSGPPYVALLAEMDALPEIGHGCGHNIAGTASIGAACALAKVLTSTQWKGTVVVLGTPAEELGKGKIAMLNAGVFNGIDAAMMAHGSSTRKLFKRFLGLVRLTFTFTGRASHASAYPEEGINALDAVIQTFNSIAALRQQLSADARVHGIITDGGKAPNIIPETASCSFYVRAKGLEGLNSVKEKVIKCAEGAALATGCGLAVSESPDWNAPMKENKAFIGVYRGALDFLGLKEDASDPSKNVGSSDIGNVSQAVPVIHPYVPIKPGINIHTREFASATVTPDGHRALMEGVKCLALTAIELLLNPRILEEIKTEFKKN